MGKIVSYTHHEFNLAWLKYLKQQTDILSLWIECPNGVWTICAEYKDGEKNEDVHG